MGSAFIHAQAGGGKEAHKATYQGELSVVKKPKGKNMRFMDCIVVGYRL